MQSAVNVAYIFASVLFILGMKMLGKASTARNGNLVSGGGMVIAVAAALLSEQILSFHLIAIAIAIGLVFGIFSAHRVKMIQMPEMVALLNGFGGLASTLVGAAEIHKISIFGWQKYLEMCGSMNTISIIYTAKFATFAAILIGTITFSGSLMAYLKLSGKFKFSPRVSKTFNLLLFLSAIWFGAVFIAANNINHGVIYALVVISLILGFSVVVPIGGGDMPVVISLLNSLSGMAATATGFIMANVVLIVAGCLVGTSGLILTVIMCKSMNRSLRNVLFSGFSGGGESSGSDGKEPQAISVEDAYCVLEAAKNVVFVPGYGMAVAQAQHVARELGMILENNGTDVRFGIHPVAGRMPGHMNVLLAEADVPYEQLVDMETINEGIKNVDVAVIIGANDVVNPAAVNDKSSPIYGMPIINAHLAKSVFVLKRGAGTGFSGQQNPLFSMENTRMLYGDAKKTISALVACFKGR
ncbi:MAG: NAD(P)(+) transhydrogenase (Re/Si-specific) subunit beta [Puniceicoccales bacterium]|jgi:NAD(P) transhydrogenase subunit beta|nr:NAD(P)(+) transhydrogenase (Re/Si-specific) subunit beta [Puniceicoccales bacterium]